MPDKTKTPNPEICDCGKPASGIFKIYVGFEIAVGGKSQHNEQYFCGSCFIKLRKRIGGKTINEIFAYPPAAIKEFLTVQPEGHGMDLEAAKKTVQIASDVLGHLCKEAWGGRLKEAWHWEIPANPKRDTDLQIGAVIRVARDAIEEITRLRAAESIILAEVARAKWTKETPKANGYYWARHEWIHEYSEKFLVKIRISKNRVTMIDSHGRSQNINVPCDTREFAGPITEPSPAIENPA